MGIGDCLLAGLAILHLLQGRRGGGTHEQDEV